MALTNNFDRYVSPLFTTKALQVLRAAATHHGLCAELHGAALIHCHVCRVSCDGWCLHQQTLTHNHLTTTCLLHSQNVIEQSQQESSQLNVWRVCAGIAA